MENSNDQLFELMTKMYTEMQEIKSEMHGGFEKVNSEIKDIKSVIKEVKTEVVKTNFVIENEIKPKLEALFDGYKHTSEAITSLQDDVNTLRLSVNDLHIKTIANDSSIISFNRKLNNLNIDKH